ncbi:MULTISPECIES: ABC transporter ATP-binding protein [unclassified Clostridium]|uniref:ABC transporter ATP-binding protein n=1 Tax=unclassified Clostridium TaxID=2614128 RepID=UPI000297E8E1|nr:MULTISPECIES: ABC transporter ATP-binding protein [unclassified Clostridium]EKQ58044.1 MAG: ABC-type multidrug transport system, ATPase and permease component [Clostridium sp. Maddingley MBC34-26]
MSENNNKHINSNPRRSARPGGGPMAMMKGEKARDFKGTMRKLIKYLGVYRISIVIVFFLAIISAGLGVAGPKILGKATTRLFEGIMAKISGTGDIDFDYIRNIIFALVVLYIFSALFAYVQGWIMSSVSMKVSYNMRKELSEKINKMPLRYFDSTNHGEVLSRITNDVDTLSQTLNQSLSQIITSVTTVIGVLIMMLTISWQLTLVAFIMIPISFLLIIGIVRSSQKFFKQQQDYLGNVSGHVEEMYSGHLVMKAYNGERKSVEKFNKLNNQLFGSAWKSQFLTSIMMPLMNFVGNLGYVGVCILGGYLATKGSISVGDIQAFIQYVRQFTQPISQIANISNILQQTAASAERVFEFLAEEEEVTETTNPVNPENIQGNVEFMNVNFGYNPKNTVINDFSAKIKEGQRVAIVGPTGAGKTTMIKLLMRFYDINEGAILIDGHDIRDFTRRGLRSMFGMVLQDTWLYNDTIMENIRYGRLSASDEEVKKAAKAAHVDSFVHTLPDGYNLILNEEASNVSQGQKQLLTIARAILADPKILILDEATSSVDTRTEVQIQKAMNNLMKNRTSFIIAHRLSTIRDADLILVMSHGDIVEQGTHEKLLETKGFYASLYNSQFEMAETGIDDNL